MIKDNSKRCHLDATIIFARTNINISNDDKQIIKHGGKLLVFHNTEA